MAGPKLNVSPRISAKDLPKVESVYSEFAGESYRRFAGSPPCTHFKYLEGSQFGCSDRLTMKNVNRCPKTSTDCMTCVVRVRNVFKIVKRIVAFVAVLMVDTQMLWFRTNKSCQHKMVNLKLPAHSITAHDNNWIASPSNRPSEESLLYRLLASISAHDDAGIASYPTMTTYGISVIPSNHRKPSFSWGHSDDDSMEWCLGWS